MDVARTAFGVSVAALLVVASLTVPEMVVDRIYGPPIPRAAAAPPFDRGLRVGDTRARPTLVPPEEAPQARDIRGNDIARPVARYRIDGTGSLYEVHSPQTELPRLKPPQL